MKSRTLPLALSFLLVPSIGLLPGFMLAWGFAEKALVFGLAHCENAEKVSPPHPIKYLANDLRSLRAKSGDRLRFSQYR